LKKIIHITLLLLFPLFGLKAQYIFNQKTDSLILSGIHQNFACQFDSASQTFQHLVDSMPNHPVGYFHQAVVLQSKMLDLETDLWESDFFRLLEKTITLSQKQSDNADEPWLLYYTGSAYCCKGLYQAQKGSYLSGYLSARKGTKFLKKAVDQDATLYDVYLLLGGYYYWSGRFSKFIRWLPFVGDKRDEGIEMLQLAVEKSAFSHWPAVENLAWVEYDRKNFQTALYLFKKGLNQFPQSRFYLWGTADSYFRLGDYQRAAYLYESLLRIVMELPFNNGYNEIVCRFKLVKTYHEFQQFEKALHHCQQILKKKLEPDIQKRVQERREETAKYIAHIHKMLQENE